MSQLFIGAMFLCVAVGLWLRSRGVLYSTLALWLDEATWASIVIRERWTQWAIRPIGFMAVSRLMVQVFGTGELALRFLPWFAGCATTVLSVPFARRFFTSRASQLLFVAIIALHPEAIDFAREFKPYSVSLALHLLCAFLAASYWLRGTTRWLLATVSVAWIGVFFGQDTLFAYPGLYLAMAIPAWRRRRWRHLALLGGFAMVTVGTLIALYLLQWRKMRLGGDSSDSAYWGRKYDVFFSLARPNHPSRLGWVVRKIGEIIAFPGSRHDLWDGRGLTSEATAEKLRAMDILLWTVVGSLGILVIAVQRRLREFLLLVLPLCVMLVFNQLAFWPFGVFRTNVFTLFYAAALAAVAFDAFRDPRPQLRQFLPALVLVALPLGTFERTWHAWKVSALTASSSFPEAVEKLIELRPEQGAKERLVLDRWACLYWDYTFHINTSYGALRERAERRFTPTCVPPRHMALPDARRLARSTGERVWMLAVSGGSMSQILKAQNDDYVVADRMTVGPAQETVIASIRRARRHR